MSLLSSSQGRRPQRAAAQEGDAKRKLNPDSSSDSDQANVSPTHVKRPRNSNPLRRRISKGNRAKISPHPSRVLTSNGSAGTRAKFRKGASHSNFLPIIHPKRPRTLSNASSSSLSSLPSDMEIETSPAAKSSITRLKPTSTPSHSTTSNTSLPSSQGTPGTPSSSRAKKRADSVTSIPTDVDLPLSQSQAPVSMLFQSFSKRPTEDVWRLEEVIKPHNAVFVKLSKPPSEGDSIDNSGSIWWPATVTKDGTKALAHDGKIYRLVVLADPSHNNIVTLHNPLDERPRFSEQTYFVGEADTKSQVLDSLWRTAMKEADLDELDDNVEVDIAQSYENEDKTLYVDSLHETDYDASNEIEQTEQAKQEKRQQRRLVAEARCEEDQVYIGEKVLARTGENHTSYWPAQIKDVYLTEKSNTIWFKVERWGEKRPIRVRRTDIFFELDEGFRTCTMGQREAIMDSRSKSRDQSPVPSLPSPPGSEFIQLPIYEQIAYVRTVLFAIIRDEFPPALEQVDSWYARAKRDDTGYGGMEQSEIVKEVLRVILREESTSASAEVHTSSQANIVETASSPEAELPVDTDTENVSAEPDLTLPSSGTTVGSDDSNSTLTTAADLLTPAINQNNSARPRGSQRYEQLGSKGRKELCTDVLAPQAARQLALWRTERRAEVAILSPDEEERLYKEAGELIGNKQVPLGLDLYDEVKNARNEKLAFKTEVSKVKKPTETNDVVHDGPTVERTGRTLRSSTTKQPT